jgi:hypothetical protein
MEEIIETEMKNIMDLDKSLYGVLLCDQNGHTLFNLESS